MKEWNAQSTWGPRGFLLKKPTQLETREQPSDCGSLPPVYKYNSKKKILFHSKLVKSVVRPTTPSLDLSNIPGLEESTGTLCGVELLDDLKDGDIHSKVKLYQKELQEKEMTINCLQNRIKHQEQQIRNLECTLKTRSLQTFQASTERNTSPFDRSKVCAPDSLIRISTILNSLSKRKLPIVLPKKLKKLLNPINF